MIVPSYQELRRLLIGVFFPSGHLEGQAAEATKRSPAEATPSGAHLWRGRGRPAFCQLPDEGDQASRRGTRSTEPSSKSGPCSSGSATTHRRNEKPVKGTKSHFRRRATGADNRTNTSSGLALVSQTWAVHGPGHGGGHGAPGPTPGAAFMSGSADGREGFRHTGQLQPKGSWAQCGSREWDKVYATRAAICGHERQGLRLACAAGALLPKCPRGMTPASAQGTGGVFVGLS